MWPSQICVGDLALTKDDQQDLGQIGRNFISRCAQQGKQKSEQFSVKQKITEKQTMPKRKKEIWQRNLVLFPQSYGFLKIAKPSHLLDGVCLGLIQKIWASYNYW